MKKIKATKAGGPKCTRNGLTNPGQAQIQACPAWPGQGQAQAQAYMASRDCLLFPLWLIFSLFVPFRGEPCTLPPGQGQARAQAYMASRDCLLFSLWLIFFTFRPFPRGALYPAAQPGPGRGLCLQEAFFTFPLLFISTFGHGVKKQLK